MNALSLSVVMPVRNGLPFLDESVASILDQTYRDFEFLILDDASSDGTTQRLREWSARDGRIKLVESSTPLGPAASSQQAAARSSGSLIARMDADDRSHPDRLRQQVDLFAAEPEAGLCGTLASIIDEAGQVVRGPASWALSERLSTPPIVHSSIMFRRSVWEQVGGYRAGHDYWEDIDLYLRIGEVASTYVIPADLVQVRLTRQSVRSATALLPLAQAYDAMHRRLNRLGPDPSDKLLPSAFLTLATPRLWAGERPHILMPLLRHAELRPNPELARALIWAGLSEISPGLLRLLLNGGAWLKSLRMRPGLNQLPWLRWRARQPCKPVSGSCIANENTAGPAPFVQKADPIIRTDMQADASRNCDGSGPA